MEKGVQQQILLKGVDLAKLAISKSMTKVPDNRVTRVMKYAEKSFDGVVKGKLKISEVLAEIMYLTEA